MQDPVSILRATELFGLLSDDVLQAVVDHSDSRSCAPGERIFGQGEEGDALYVLEDGAVRIVNADGGVLATLSPPSTFGELGLMQQQRTATAEAIESSTVRVIGRDKFLILMREHPTVSDALYRAVGALLKRVLDRTSDLVFLDLHGRVARLLLERAKQGDRPGELALNPTEDGLSDELGAATSTVHEILTTFEERGYVELDGDSIIIREPELLARRAGL